MDSISVEENGTQNQYHCLLTSVDSSLTFSTFLSDMFHVSQRALRQQPMSWTSSGEMDLWPAIGKRQSLDRRCKMGETAARLHLLMSPLASVLLPAHSAPGPALILLSLFSCSGVA